MTAEELLKWFHEQLLPGLVRKGYFAENGESQVLQRCEFETTDQGISSFASVSRFAKISLEASGGSVTLDLLVKFQSQDSLFREKMKTNPQFRNEVAMYGEVLPGFVEFLKRCDRKPELIQEVVPKCYFALFEDGNPENSIVILKDLRNLGFKLSESVTELDWKHCSAAVGRLAEFHAISFAMKFREWKHFEKLKKSFVDVWLSDDPVSRQQCEEFKSYTCQRGIEYLLAKKDSGVPEEYLKNLKKLLEPIFDLLKSLCSPREPLSVICHGDFNRNNILFSCASGEVTDAKLIDFQTSLYGSPCLDLSFFIYMNTTLEFREQHFDDIFRHYYSVLIGRISGILNEAEEAIAGRIPIQAFREEFARVAIQAYVTVSFFLPVMIAPSGADFEEELKTKSFKEMALENYSAGGEEVSKRIAEVIVDFYRRKFYM